MAERPNSQVFLPVVGPCSKKARQRDEWDIVKENEQNIVAIVSTPSLVCEFLNRAFRLDKGATERRFPFLSREHREACYDKQEIDHTNILDIVPFTKSARFKNQREYRFVLDYAWLHGIDTFVFCAGIDYMERRDDNRFSNFANPEMSQQNKEKPRLTLMIAGTGYRDFAGKQIPEVIANADLLFR